MIDLNEITRQLGANAAAMHALVQAFTQEGARWKPDAETWSLTQVMEHVYNEERIDFRQHLRELLNDPPQPWGAFDQGWQPVADCQQALAGFLREREASITWLKALESPDREATIEARFGPAGEVYVFRAGDLLASWVEHDYLHTRQMVELLHAWNVSQAAPYSVAYAGDW